MPCSHMPKRTKLRGKLARFGNNGPGVKAPSDSLLKSKLLFVSLGGADSPVRDSGPRGGVRHSEGLHDC